MKNFPIKGQEDHGKRCVLEGNVRCCRNKFVFRKGIIQKMRLDGLRGGLNGRTTPQWS